MAKYRPSIGQLLAALNTGYHADGTIKKGLQIVARYYKCDRLPDSALATVKEHYPSAYRGRASSQYAPELNHPCLIVPTDAEIRRQAVK